MGLVYRAMWTDPQEDLGAFVKRYFDAWVANKYQRPEGSSDSFEANGTKASVVEGAADQDGVKARQFVLTEDTGTQRWSTTVRSLSNDEEWIWVDVELVSDHAFRHQHVDAPAVVKNMLESSIAEKRTPKVGPAPLSYRAQVIPASTVRSSLVDLINDPDRTTSVVVFSHRASTTPDETIKRANQAARTLAGTATVFVLQPSSNLVFDSALGKDLSVWGGAARLYLPGAMYPARHRFIQYEKLIEGHNIAGRSFRNMLVQGTCARRAPGSYEKVRPELRAEGIQDIYEMYEELDTEVRELRQQLESSEQMVLAQVDDITELQGILREYRYRERELRQKLSGDESEPTAPALRDLTPRSLTEVGNLARLHLTHVSVPESACCELGRLDQAIESENWASTAWDGFVALNAYAEDAPTFNGDFRIWCEAGKNPDHWRASNKKLAMRESETVMGNKKLRRTRELPVDRSLCESGTVIMEAHLKVSEGGGGLAPRIYFYDDTKGVTKKVHVGFFGPHNLMPNTRTN